MPSYVSLQTLINRVLQRSNLEGAIDYTNASPPVKFCSVAEVTDLINEGYKNEVYDLLRQYVGDNYFRSVPPFTFYTLSTTTLYPAPQDLLSIISVDVWAGGQYPLSARRYQEDQRNALRGFPIGWSSPYPGWYQLQGSGPTLSINMLPAHSAGFQVDVNYVKNFTPLVNLTDVLDDINGWSEIAILDAASKLALKDGQIDVSQYLRQMKAEFKAKIQAMGPQRSPGEPERVNMIEGRTEYGDGWMGGWG